MKALVVGDVIDDILVRPKSPVRTNTDVESVIQVSPGGSAANFACWLASEGAEVNFVGRVNAIDIDRHAAILQSYGVKPFLQSDEELPTGSIVVLVEGENRTFLTDRGANKNLNVSDIEAALFGDLLYLSGYSLMSLSKSDIQDLIARAHQNGAQVACDPGSAGFIEDFGIKEFLISMSGVDILLPNLEEGRLLSGENRPELICDFLAERFGTVVLTMGSHGCAIRTVGEYFTMDAIPAEVVDSTGAGDAFAAGFLNALLRGDGVQAAATKGTRAGAKAVTKLGGRP